MVLPMHSLSANYRVPIKGAPFCLVCSSLLHPSSHFRQLFRCSGMCIANGMLNKACMSTCNLLKLSLSLSYIL